MSNGICINKEHFVKLKSSEQLGILYENMEELKTMIRGYKFDQKVQYGLIGFMFIFVGASKYLPFI